MKVRIALGAAMIAVGAMAVFLFVELGSRGGAAASVPAPTPTPTSASPPRISSGGLPTVVSYAPTRRAPTKRATRESFPTPDVPTMRDWKEAADKLLAAFASAAGSGKVPSGYSESVSSQIERMLGLDSNRSVTGLTHLEASWTNSPLYSPRSERPVDPRRAIVMIGYLSGEIEVEDRDGTAPYKLDPAHNHLVIVLHNESGRWRVVSVSDEGSTLDTAGLERVKPKSKKPKREHKTVPANDRGTGGKRAGIGQHTPKSSKPGKQRTDAHKQRPDTKSDPSAVHARKHTDKRRTHRSKEARSVEQ